MCRPGLWDSLPLSASVIYTCCKVSNEASKKSDDLAKCKEITTMAWCQLSVKSCVEGFGYYGKIYFWPLSLHFSLLSFAAGLCLLSLLPNMFGPRGAANGGGQFDSREMLESAIHSLTIQVKCPQCTMADPNSLNTNGKLLISIHLTKLLTWLYSVCPSKPINWFAPDKCSAEAFSLHLYLWHIWVLLLKK